MSQITANNWTRFNLRVTSKKKLTTSSFLFMIFTLLWGLFCFNIGHFSASHSSCWQKNLVTSRNLTKQTKSHFPSGSQSTDAFHDSNKGERRVVFPESVSAFAIGLTTVPRKDFLQKEIDIGVPFFPNSRGNSEVLLLYSELAALPDQAQSKAKVRLSNTSQAIANCNELHVALTPVDQDIQQCVAIVGHHESFHIQKFLRRDAEAGQEVELEDVQNIPLTIHGRGESVQYGEEALQLPTGGHRRTYWKLLRKYISNLEKTLDQLRPIAEKAAVNNTVVLMVCNFGQSELLLNFICSLQRRQIDLSSAALIVFATDKKTYDLVSAMGVPVFYDEVTYGKMPENAADAYGDDTYTVLMLAKVFCVHMVNALGYDVLFQDVDMIWYRNPLEFFHKAQEDTPNIDIYFQEDGNHDLVYTPYSANTGFYLVKNNDRTRHFLHSILMAGEIIVATHSHQAVLNAILVEHISLFNLRVKILSDEEGMFPCGYAFHRRPEYMKELFAGSVKPVLFHMSWTINKQDKVEFFQHMGEWHVDNEKCRQKTSAEILGKEDSVVLAADTTPPLLSRCCIAEPPAICHYTDLPSKVSCSPSPSSDEP